MKIDSNNIKPLVSGTGAVAENETRPGKSEPSDVPASSNVQLSSLATNLNKAQEALADAPVVNAGRVAELTQAIREDRFTVDASKVADKLVETAAELIRTHKG